MEDLGTHEVSPASACCVQCGLAPRIKLIRDHCEKCYRRNLYAVKKASAIEPRKVPRSISERLLAKAAEASNGCVIWTGTVNKATGYGALTVNNKNQYAHRVSYATFVGPIPAGMILDHTCHNRDVTCRGGSACLHRRCINPAHLEPVSSRQNILRSPLSVAGRNSRKSHCKRGHEFTPENTRRGAHGRICRECVRVLARRERAANT